MGKFEKFFEAILSQLPMLGTKIGTAIVVFGLFWVGGISLKKIIIRVSASRHIDPDIGEFLARGVKVTLIVFGAVTALGTAGIDVGALVAGLGLIGFALGFALKDIISNTLAGILIIIYKPYGRGDRIKVSSFEGVVKSIDLRYTVLELKAQEIYVPNSMLFTNAIIVGEKASE